MTIHLSDNFTYKRLLRFVLPSVVMMIFTSIYGVVDGFFVCNYAGKQAFASINLVMPFLLLPPAVGFMIGAGGTALVSKKMGEGKSEEANEAFSLLVYVVIGFGIVTAILGYIFMENVSLLLGATEEMLPYCVEYGRIIMYGMTLFMLQNMFQTFLIAAEKPRLGLVLTVAAGVTNMVLDALLVGYFRLGVGGAAAATCLSQVVGGLVPLVYFALPNKSLLRLGRATGNMRVLVKSCTNGSSEFMTNISMSVVNMLYNGILMEIAGEDGVAAYGIIMYIAFFFVAVYIGYSIGVAPIVGYKYGANDRPGMHNIFTKSLFIIGACSVAMTVLAVILAKPLSSVFVGYSESLCAMTERAFVIYSFSFLLAGFNIFGSSFFTALGNGLVSAIISFLRALVFQVVSVFALSAIFGLDGVWSAVIFAEAFSIVVTLSFFVSKRKKYGY